MTEDNTRSANGDSSVKECERMIQRSLRLPIVKFLREHLAKSGCSVGENFFKAINCNEKYSGGYISGDGIHLCRNWLKSQSDVDWVIHHELIHAFDNCRAANLNLKSCAHRACTEIRAAHLSGECHYKSERLRGLMKKMRAHEPECVKRRALESMSSSPHWSDSLAKDCVEAVWDVCYNDTQPFDRNFCNDSSTFIEISVGCLL